MFLPLSPFLPAGSLRQLLLPRALAPRFAPWRVCSLFLDPLTARGLDRSRSLGNLHYFLTQPFDEGIFLPVLSLLNCLLCTQLSVTKKTPVTIFVVLP